MANIEQISVFDILKIGIGPSSSHTLGPWKAVQRFLQSIQKASRLSQVSEITVELYGSLSKTGKGHGTDTAIMLALSGEDPETVDTNMIQQKTQLIRQTQSIDLMGIHPVNFSPEENIIFRPEKLSYHPNGIRIWMETENGERYLETYYSVGGGFVVKEGEELNPKPDKPLPYPAQTPQELLANTQSLNGSIADVLWKNEQTWRSDEAIRTDLLRLWEVMRDSVYQGCHTEGILPGGLEVSRRAPLMYKKLIPDSDFRKPEDWLDALTQINADTQQTLKWVSCFAFAVNEENAAFGRIVTAPTNGAAGVIPAVLLYHLCFCRKQIDEDTIVRFLLVAGEIGSYYKKGATISAAMGGCQAEIGVSSSMAAAALTECSGGTPAQALMAAEIAMEHHLGLTCDPVGGLVQIPCIERNSMGAIKAITASNIALDSDPKNAKVTLDQVIDTMWQTAQDMSDKYKETSEGGLAIKVPVNISEC
uniref:L-serine dehydratase n=1 Tax=Roseihalotalea indica TaxID=2867963 RepID=A0AA49GQ80_9BACT|nr:L-serine ammonia-lyase [Tunicatimonas sp. TK19036]